MKRLLPPSLRGTNYEKMADTFEDALTGANGFIDYINKIKWLYDLDETDRDSLTDISQWIYGVPKTTMEAMYEFARTNGDTDDLATGRLREEVKKLPILMKHRGTRQMYVDLFGAFSYFFHGLIAPMPAYDDTYTSRLLTDIKLQDHHTASTHGLIAQVPIEENLVGQVSNSTTLDTTGSTLDSGNIFDRLDFVDLGESTLYNRNILVGWQIDRNNFETANTLFPYQLEKYLIDAVKQNRRAVDAPNLTAVLSLNFESSAAGYHEAWTGANFGFQVTTNSADTSDVVYYKMQFMDGNTINYEAYLGPISQFDNSCVYSGDSALSFNGNCEGQRTQHIFDSNAQSTSSSKKFTIDLTPGSGCIYKLHNGHDDFYLFKSDMRGNVSLAYKSESTPDVTFAISGNVITIASTGSESIDAYNNLTMSCPTVGVDKINRIKVVAVKASSSVTVLDFNLKKSSSVDTDVQLIKGFNFRVVTSQSA